MTTRPAGKSGSRNMAAHIYPPATPVEKLPPYLTSGQASAWLDVSRKKMAALISSGKLHTVASPADGRYRLVPREEVAAVRAKDIRFMSAAS